MKDQGTGARSGGRPRKFRGPSRVVTLTLPDRTIEQLSDIDGDRAKAIVKAAQFATSGARDDDTRVDLVEVSAGVALIIVPYCRYLHESPDISLAQIVPGRFLIMLPEGTPLSTVEIAVGDQLALMDQSDTRDREVLQQLLTHLRAARRANRANMASVVLVDI